MASLSQRRRRLRAFVRIMQRLLGRVEVHGTENIPDKGPLLILFNHLSTLDGVLVVGNMPQEIELVGPGDFPSTPLEDFVMRSYDIIRVNRGRPDRTSLRQMIDRLNAGKMLAMAPGGGTWEKRLTEAKGGAAYLSMMTGAPMLPVGLGGMYDVPTPGLRTLLRRPRLTFNFGEVIPAVERGKNRAEREANLSAAGLLIMQRIYDLLPPADRALYDHWTRATYTLDVQLVDEDGAPVAYDGPSLPDMSGLAEFIAKPNLFRPMKVNARLPVEPFMESRFFPPIEVQIGAGRLYELLAEGAYDVYLNYRLGDAKAEATLSALRFLHDVLCPWAMDHHARIQLTPVPHDPDLP